MADKARFFLERGLPELKELEQKKIFTKEEIQSISKKRSDFEHRINTPRCKPTDFTRYTEYEMNLDSLRKKRIKRMGIKMPSHVGSRRIFFILERATRRFHGDVGLWMQYIEYAKQERSGKLVMKVLTAALRLHPTNPSLWIYAAHTALDQNTDTTEARSFMQRGLRFNKQSRDLWVEYAKFECIFISKILARRHVLGIDRPIVSTNEGETTQDAEDDGMLMLPDEVDEDVDTRQDASLDFHALKSIDSNAALSGAIPLAVFDAAVQAIPNDQSFPASFFDMFATFTNLPCRADLTKHILSYSQDKFPTGVDTAICYVKEPLIGVEVDDGVEFIVGLKQTLSRFEESLGKVDDKGRGKLIGKFVAYLTSVNKREGLDEGVRKAVELSLGKYTTMAEMAGKGRAQG